MSVALTHPGSLLVDRSLPHPSSHSSSSSPSSFFGRKVRSLTLTGRKKSRSVSLSSPPPPTLPPTTHSSTRSSRLSLSEYDASTSNSAHSSASFSSSASSLWSDSDEEEEGEVEEEKAEDGVGEVIDDTDDATSDDESEQLHRQRLRDVVSPPSSSSSSSSGSSSSSSRSASASLISPRSRRPVSAVQLAEREGPLLLLPSPGVSLPPLHPPAPAPSSSSSSGFASPPLPPPPSHALRLQHQSPPPSHSVSAHSSHSSHPVITRSASTHTRSYSLSQPPVHSPQPSFNPFFRPIHPLLGAGSSVPSSPSPYQQGHPYPPPASPLTFFFPHPHPYPMHLVGSVPAQHPYPHRPSHAYHPAPPQPPPSYPHPFAYSPTFLSVEPPPPSPAGVAFPRTLLPRMSPSSSPASSLIHPHPRRSASLSLLASLEDSAVAKFPMPLSASKPDPLPGLQSPSAGEVAQLLACPLAELLGLTESILSRSHVPKALSRAAVLSPVQSPQHLALPSPALPPTPILASPAPTPLPQPTPAEPPPSAEVVERAAIAPTEPAPPSPSSYAAIASALPPKLSSLSSSSASVTSPSSTTSQRTGRAPSCKPRVRDRAMDTGKRASPKSLSVHRRMPPVLSSAPLSPCSALPIPAAVPLPASRCGRVNGTSVPRQKSHRQRARRKSVVEQQAKEQPPQRQSEVVVMKEEKQQEDLEPPLATASVLFSAVYEESQVECVDGASTVVRTATVVNDAVEECREAMEAPAMAWQAMNGCVECEAAEVQPLAELSSCPAVLSAVKASTTEAVTTAASVVESSSEGAEPAACAATPSTVSRRADRLSSSSSSASSRPSHRQRKLSGRPRTSSEEAQSQLTGDRRLDSPSTTNHSSAPLSSTSSLVLHTPPPFAGLASPLAVRRSFAAAFVCLHRLSSSSMSALRSVFRRRFSHQKAPQPRFVHRLKELSSSAHSTQSLHRPSKPHLMRVRHHPLLDVRADAAPSMPRWMLRCIVACVLVMLLAAAAACGLRYTKD